MHPLRDFASTSGTLLDKRLTLNARKFLLFRNIF